MKFTVINDDWSSTVTGFESRAEADNKRKSALSSFDLSPKDVTVVKGHYETYEDYQNRDEDSEQEEPPQEPQATDGGTQEVDAEVIDHSEPKGDLGTPAAAKANPRNQTPVEPETPTTAEPNDMKQEPQSDADALDQLGESLGTDPLSILPGHMIDQVQGQPAINKRGYAMIAERYGVSVKAHIESYPWENEEGRCVARAVATTDEGKEYQDFASASKGDGDMPEQLVELASTRALKRVTGWATGLGIVSFQELSQELE